MAIGNFLSVLGDMNSILLVVVFIIFIVLAYKVFKLLTKAVFIGIVGGLFPLFMGFMGVPTFFGYQMGFSITSMLTFATGAVFLFFVWVVVSGILKIGKVATSPFRGGKASKKDVEKMIKKAQKNKK